MLGLGGITGGIMERIAGILRLTDRLALRLAALLSVALLPLGIIAVVSSLDSRRTDIRSAERALVSLTADAEAGRRALVENALATAQTLAGPTIERLDDPAACSELLAETVRRAGVFGSAGFVEPDGMMHCASSGQARDFSESEVFHMMLDDPRPLVQRATTGAAGGPQELIVSHPVIENGRLLGFLSISIGLSPVTWLGAEAMLDGDAAVQSILFNRVGEVLSTAGPTHSGPGAEPAGLLPAAGSLSDLRHGPAVFSGRTAAGQEAVFAVAELVRGQLYVLGVWAPEAGPAAAAVGNVRGPLLVPLLMWLASIGTVYVAVDLLVIRHLRRLSRQMRRFALGDRARPEPIPANTSRELREVQATFQKMAALVARDEAELSDALRDKEAALAEKTVLLKEVHHRVKNNLQLIASILNLQKRRLADPRTRRVLQNVQDRVIGLAAIHRSLYQSDRLSELRADLLLDEVLRHLFAVGTEAGTGFDLETDLQPLTLEADQLVPLSLLLTEGVTNALKYLGAPAGGGRPWVRVALASDDGAVTLTLDNSLGPRPDAAAAVQQGDAAEASDQLGTELMAAFAGQLGAALENGAQPGEFWRLRLSFPREASGGDVAARAPEPDGAGAREAGSHAHDTA